jgi:Holliday junction resolvase-like predicted endonuclease
MQSKHRGAHSELVACAWLLERGYEVYRNISPHGLGDLVVVKDGQMLRIDVKTCAEGRKTRLKTWQTSQNIAAQYVFSDGKCELDLNPGHTVLRGVDCPNCGRHFMQNRGHQKFCSGLCGDNFKNRRYRANGLGVFSAKQEKKV